MEGNYEQFIEELEKLEQSVNIIEVSSEKGNLSLLEDYVREHNKKNSPQGADPHAKGNFNTYLQKKLGKNVVVVAEITGQIGIGKYDEVYDKENIAVKGADLSGSRLVNCYIFEALENVNLRDCVFENVNFQGCDLSRADLRGTKLKNCRFNRYIENDSKLQELHFDFYNEKNVRDLGFFNISQWSPVAESAKSRIVQKNEQICKQEIDEFEKNIRNERSFFARMGSLLIKTKEQEDFSRNIEQGKNQIISKYKALTEEQCKKIDDENVIRLDNPQHDPTYIPKNHKKAEAKKVLLKANQQDLDEYIRKNSSGEISFNKFIAKKKVNKEKLKNAKEENLGKKIIPVADFSQETITGLDFSELDLSEVNFAYTQIKNCKFNKTKLVATCFEGATFEGKIEFNKSNLTDASFIGASSLEGTVVKFAQAFMPRVRMMYSMFRGANFKEALLYAADFTGSDIENGVFVKANATRADLERVNMRYVDAKYVNMKKASLKNALLEGGNFSHAVLEKAVIEEVNAKESEFSNAILDYVEAEYANFEKASLESMQAEGANFTNVNFDSVNAQFANFSNAIMNEVNARFGNFQETILNDVKAHQADFSQVIMEKIRGERLDITEAILKEVNFRHANLTNAVMEKVDAYQADFKNSTLNEVNAKFARMIACNFEAADLTKMNIEGAVLPMCNMEKANCESIKFDTNTLLLDVNFKDAIGAEKLVELQKEQHKINEQLFGRSSYGICKNNEDGSNDRFKCQRIGAAVLSTLISGSTGYTLGGPFVGIGGSIVTSLISDYTLTAIKDGYFKEQGYISNKLGDKLAELGALTIATGAGSLEKAVNTIPVAATLCAATGLVSPGSIALSAGGAITVYAGVQGIKSSFGGRKSTIRKVVSVLATGIGAGAMAIGLTSFGSGCKMFAGTVLCGAAYGGVQGGLFAYNQMRDFDIENKTGMTPEEIYLVSMQSGREAFKKIWPTTNKFVCAAVFCIVGAALGLLLAESVVVTLGLGSVAHAFLATNIAFTTGVFALTCGYLFDEKLSFWAKFTQRQENSKEYYLCDKKDLTLNPEKELDIEKVIRIEEKPNPEKEFDIEKVIHIEEKPNPEKAPDTLIGKWGKKMSSVDKINQSTAKQPSQDDSPESFTSRLNDNPEATLQKSLKTHL